MKLTLTFAALACIVLQAVNAAPFLTDDADLAIRCGAEVPADSELAKRCSVFSYLVDAELEKRAHVSSYIPPEEIEGRAHVSSYIPPEEIEG
ncbi:hypothetical protein FOMPIDRAFT_86505 [Fomitopsis schrenkii]|uniref:Uncharacterized protein n=1 Tax=Fomitopsis schrenkii TaxID=2126942 RepID=S8DUL6_FOMSC|nr:hypothetical protein FOMPIDRAFT_86505 [Fomitopsis schrenkii]